MKCLLKGHLWPEVSIRCPCQFHHRWAGPSAIAIVVMWCGKKGWLGIKTQEAMEVQGMMAEAGLGPIGVSQWALPPIRPISTLIF